MSRLPSVHRLAKVLFRVAVRFYIMQWSWQFENWRSYVSSPNHHHHDDDLAVCNDLAIRCQSANLIPCQYFRSYIYLWRYVMVFTSTYVHMHKCGKWWWCWCWCLWVQGASKQLYENGNISRSTEKLMTTSQLKDSNPLPLACEAIVPSLILFLTC